MSVREASPNTMPITQGSLDEIESIKVTGEKKVISSLVALCTHDKVITKRVFIEIFSHAVSKYGTGEIASPMQSLQREE